MLEIFKDRATISLILMLLLLVVCNYAFVYSRGWSRWGWQLISFGGLFAIYKFAGLTLSDIGLSWDKIGTGVKYGLVAAGLALVAFLVLYFINYEFFGDSRYHQGLQAALITGLLVVPLKTVLFEEIAFRGILPALLKEFSGSFIVILIVSSLLFGLWHILSAPKADMLSIGSFSNILVIGGVFLATSIGGAVLYFLRDQSDSLVASIIVHWFVNGFTILLSSISWLQHH